MILKVLSNGSEDIALLEKINEEAIPENERNSLADLMATGADVIGIYENDEPAGFLVVREYGEIVYLAYLATRYDLRGQGIGGRALEKLVAMHRDQPVIVESEAPADCSDENDMNQRRKQFYLRNGFFETGWYTYYDETEFEIGCSKKDYDAEAFERFVAYLSSIISDHIPKPYRKEKKINRTATWKDQG